MTTAPPVDERPPSTPSQQATPSDASDTPSLTPSPRAVLRRARTVIVLVLIAALIGLITLVGAGTNANRLNRGPTNPAPDGTLALVNVLRQHGVHVRVVDSADAAARALSPRSTLLVDDVNGLLTSASQWRRVAALHPATLVLVQPSAAARAALAPGVGASRSLGTIDLASRCSLEPAARSGAIVSSSGDRAFRTTGEAVGCYTSAGSAALVRTSVADGETVWVLGAASILTNDRIDHAGNAALALGLTGEHRTLVWYVPGIADLRAAGKPTLADLTPGWVTPLVALLAAVAVAAAIWRGRRMGALVVENLPVVVRSAETVEGRARLYQVADARLRALDSLRIGSLGRIATRLNLPASAPARDVADAAAAACGIDRAFVHSVLLDATPGTDADLVRLSDELLRLERAVSDSNPAVHSEQTSTDHYTAHRKDTHD